MIRVLDHGFIRLVDYMGSDSAICEAARVSYQNHDNEQDEGKDRNLLRYLLRHRHTTPFEMCEVKFHVKAPIFVVRQWFRHRTWSYNEISARYTELPEQYYQPNGEWRYQSRKNKQGGAEECGDAVTANAIADSESSFTESFERYRSILEMDVSREQARIVLPLATYTEFYAKTNLHNLLHFLKLRLDSHAQWEIRQYAIAMHDLVCPKFPQTMLAFHDYVHGAVTLTRLEVEALREKRPLSLACSDRERREFDDKRRQLGLRDWPQVDRWMNRESIEAFGVRWVLPKSSKVRFSLWSLDSMNQIDTDGMRFFTNSGTEIVLR